MFLMVDVLLAVLLLPGCVGAPPNSPLRPPTFFLARSGLLECAREASWRLVGLLESAHSLQGHTPVFYPKRWLSRVGVANTIVCRYFKYKSATQSSAAKFAATQSSTTKSAAQSSTTKSAAQSSTTESPNMVDVLLAVRKMHFVTFKNMNRRELQLYKHYLENPFYYKGGFERYLPHCFHFSEFDPKYLTEYDDHARKHQLEVVESALKKIETNEKK